MITAERLRQREISATDLFWSGVITGQQYSDTLNEIARLWDEIEAA